MNIKITLLLVLALFSVSTSPIIAKALGGVSAISISFWRMFFASIILWMFSYFKPQGKIKVDENKNKIIYAGILLGIHFALFFTAIKTTNITTANTAYTVTFTADNTFDAGGRISISVDSQYAPYCY